MPETISQQDLERYFWGAAVLLRGYIDASDYKQFIFPLLYFKRVCDVFDEEAAEVTKEYGPVSGKIFPSITGSVSRKAPTGRRSGRRRPMWGLRSRTQCGRSRSPILNNSHGIFGEAPWTNKSRLSDETLRDLIEHFSSETLSLSHVPQDELGQGYEYLIKKFADDSGHTAAEFYTNRTLVKSYDPHARSERGRVDL